MAPHKKNRFRPAQKVATKRIKQRRRRPTTNQRTPLASLIVKGVNAIISAIPVAKIFQPVTDFMFKSFGLSIGSVPVTAETVSASVAVYGLGAAFAVPLSAIIENAPILAKHHSDNKVQLYTNFTHGQLLQIRVTVRPIGELSHRQGNVALAFIPYTTSESGRYYDQNVDIPHLQDVLLVPGAVQGSGTRTLSVNFRSRGPQFSSLPHPLETEIGLVLVSYEDTSRNSGKEFAAEDFGAEIIISGAVKLSNPLPHVGYATVSCDVHDKLASKTIRVGNYTVSNGVCEDSGMSVKVSGVFTPSKITPNNDVKKEELRIDHPGGSPLSVISMLEAAALDA